MRIKFHTKDAAIFTDEQIGRSQEFTPEGFLLCKGVPIARLGEMLYAPQEIPDVEPGPDGIVRISRDEAALFDPVAIASFEGKPVTLDHPEEGVTPETWRDVAVGTVHNVRRGEGDDADKLVADLLITDADAIDSVISKKRVEVSAGYDTDYISTERAGYGLQRNIVGNHVALVEKGRCGPSCSIKDKETVTMATTKIKRRSLLDRLMARAKANDEEGVREILEDAGVDDLGSPEGSTEGATININLSGATPSVSGTTTDDGEEAAKAAAAAAQVGADDPMAKLVTLVTAIGTRLEALETKVNGAAAATTNDTDEEVDLNAVTANTNDADTSEEGDQKVDNGGEGDQKNAVTMDAAAIKDDWRDTISRAELILPGFKIPTFDKKMDRKMAFDAVCGFRRKMLLSALHNDTAAAFVKPLLGSRDIRKMTCDSVLTVFVSASELAKNSRSQGVIMPANFKASKTEQDTPANINERNAKFWATR